MALYIKIGISNCLLPQFIVASRRSAGGKNAACGLNDKGRLPQPISFIFCNILEFSHRYFKERCRMRLNPTLQDRMVVWIFAYRFAFKFLFLSVNPKRGVKVFALKSHFSSLKL